MVIDDARGFENALLAEFDVAYFACRLSVPVGAWAHWKVPRCYSFTTTISLFFRYQVNDSHVWTRKCAQPNFA